MKYEFMAKNEIDAAGIVMKWIHCGILPNDCSYAISENPDRTGYYIAKAIV